MPNLLRSGAHLLRWFAAGLLIIALAGFVYQTVSAQVDKRNYPPPGQQVDVGGYRLHIHCVGQGSPSVILDAAADMTSADWAWVQPEVARYTRVCAYDRAGMGWSDSGPSPRGASQVSAELHTLLVNAGVDGPYVLVGHSAGALYALRYAAEHPEDVVGMVLVDPGHPEMSVRIPELQAQDASDRQLVGTMQFLSYLGVPRLLGIGQANAQGLPPAQVAATGSFVATPTHWSTLLALIDATPTSYAEVRQVTSLGDLPLAVVSANTAWFSRGAAPDAARRTLNELHAELANLSTDHRHYIVDGATHASLLHQQDDAQSVISAIEEVWTAAQIRGEE